MSVLAALVLISASASARQDRVRAISSPTDVIDLWGGAVESFALRSDGTVWTWGWDDYGILGNGHGVTMFDPSKAYDCRVPFQVLGLGGTGHLESIQAIAGGERHNVALDSNGDVWTWGWNAYGILGRDLGPGTCSSNDAHNTDCMGTTPGKIPGFSSVKAIASRGYHTLALKNDGSVWAWGRGDWGLLGDGFNLERHSPVQVVGLTGHGGVTSISSGGEVSVTLMGDHSLMAWGRNNAGQVGNGTADPGDIGQWTPAPVSQATGLTNVK